MGIMESLGYVNKSRLDEALDRGRGLEKELEELRGKVSVLEAEKSELEKKHQEALEKSKELESQVSKLREEPEAEEEES
jgi:peptidoglycan hydrolase CwlO-like protein